MGDVLDRLLLRLTSKGRTVYVAWSTNVDAPVGIWRSIEDIRREFEENLARQRRIGQFDNESRPEALAELNFREAYQTATFERKIERLKRRGHTRTDDEDPAKSFVAGNRAGPNETQLSLSKLVDHCLKELERWED